jgi:hypothetical protein
MVNGEIDAEYLLVAWCMPILIARTLMHFKDKRDSIRNLKALFVWQLMTLPAIPLVYLLMSAYWPKNVSPLFVLIVILALIIIPAMSTKIKLRAWKIKERVFTLSVTAQTKNLLEVQAEIKQILFDLSSQKLILNDAVDHTDRADSYWKLGQLQTNLMQFSDAEKSYRAAIEAYNDVLKVDVNNRTAIANKFNTVESLNLLQRTRF